MAELNTALAFDAVAYGDDDIETINRRWSVLGKSIMQNLHITIFIQFTFFENIGNMTCDYGLVFLKEHCHLRLRKPNRFVLHPDINNRLSVIGLVDYNLIRVHDSSRKISTAKVVIYFLFPYFCTRFRRACR